MNLTNFFDRVPEKQIFSKKSNSKSYQFTNIPKLEKSELNKSIFITRSRLKALEQNIFW